MLAGDALGRAGLPGFDGGMHKVVLVREVAGRDLAQRVHLVQRGGHLGRVVDVEAAHAHQRVGHEQAQRLVDRGIEVVAVRHGGFP